MRTQRHIPGGLQTSVSVPGLRFLDLFRLEAHGPGSPLKERMGRGAWEPHSGMAAGWAFCLVQETFGRLSWVTPPNCSSCDSSYFSYLSPFLPLYLPFLLVIKMSLCCLAILSLENFPSLLSWSRCLPCCSERSCELADEALSEGTAAGSPGKPRPGYTRTEHRTQSPVSVASPFPWTRVASFLGVSYNTLRNCVGALGLLTVDTRKSGRVTGFWKTLDQCVPFWRQLDN